MMFFSLFFSIYLGGINKVGIKEDGRRDKPEKGWEDGGRR